MSFHRRKACPLGVGNDAVNLGDGTLTLSGHGAITQTAALIAHGANLTTTTGAITADNSANAVDLVSLSTGGSDKRHLHQYLGAHRDLGVHRR